MFNQKEYMDKYNGRYYIKNRDRIIEDTNKYYHENKSEINRKRKQYYNDNSERIKKQVKQYRKNNLENYKEQRNKRLRDRRKTDLKFNLNHRMSTAIGTSLRSNKAGRNWESLVGYTLKDLIKLLGRTMPKNYTWDDVLSGKLHIDHIIPKSVFNYTKPEHIDFKRCWALSNLQLLPARENIIKNAKITKPFQLALQI